MNKFILLTRTNGQRACVNVDAVCYFYEIEHKLHGPIVEVHFSRPGESELWFAVKENLDQINALIHGRP